MPTSEPWSLLWDHDPRVKTDKLIPAFADLPPDVIQWVTSRGRGRLDWIEGLRYEAAIRRGMADAAVVLEPVLAQASRHIAERMFRTVHDSNDVSALVTVMEEVAESLAVELATACEQLAYRAESQAEKTGIHSEKEFANQQASALLEEYMPQVAKRADSTFSGRSPSGREVELRPLIAPDAVVYILAENFGALLQHWSERPSALRQEARRCDSVATAIEELALRKEEIAALLDEAVMFKANHADKPRDWLRSGPELSPTTRAFLAEPGLDPSPGERSAEVELPSFP